jgi:HK97 family phage prohead protease
MDKMLLTFNSVIKDINEKEGTLTAYVSTGHRDRMDEVLLPEGADMKNFRKNPVVLWAHQYDQPPIGKALWIKNDGDGILAKVKFASTEFAQEILGLFKEGILNAFSVGFIPKEYTDGDGEKKPRRTYNNWELLEFSAVPVPANPEALSLAMSKGLIKSEALKKDLKISDPAPEAHKDINEEIAALTSENDQLKADKTALENTIKDKDVEIRKLRYDIYKLLNKPNPASEISGKDVANIIRDVIAGEVRRVTGKVS